MPEKVSVQANYDTPFQIGEDVINRGLTRYVNQRNWPSHAVGIDTISTANITLPDGQHVSISISDDPEAISPENEGDLSLFPLGAVNTEVVMENDIPNGTMTKRVVGLPLGVDIVPLGNLVGNSTVIVEFPRDGTIEARNTFNGPTTYLDPNVPVGDTSRVRESTFMYIPSQRARELGKANITIRRGH